MVKALAVGTGTKRAVQRLKGDEPRRAERDRKAVLMFKRVIWLGVGFTVGVGTTVVAARKARQQLDRYKPPALVDRVTTTIATGRPSRTRSSCAAARARPAARRARTRDARADALDARHAPAAAASVAATARRRPASCGLANGSPRTRRRTTEPAESLDGTI